MYNLLVTSIFSFPHNVFKSPIPHGCKKLRLCGKELKLYYKNPIFNNPKEEGFGKQSGKRRKCS